MHLPKTILDVVRGASGAAVALAIGCSSSHSAPIRSEPVARLSPIVIAPAAPVAPVVVAPPAPIATLEPVPAAAPTPANDDAADAGVRHRRHRHTPPGLGTIGTPPGYDPMMANCGRG